MDVRVLGKLEVLCDGEAVDLGSFRQRSLLALLLTDPKSVFSTDKIIDSLWGDSESSDKQNAVWVYVSGLRKALEPDRPKRTDGTMLLTRAHYEHLTASGFPRGQMTHQRRSASGLMIS